VDRLLLHLDAVHDPPGLRGARAHPELVPGGVPRSRRSRWPHASHDHPPARAARDRGGLDLHLLPDARRLHHAAARRRRAAVHRECRLLERRDREQRPLRGGVRDGAGHRHGHLPRRREAARGVRGFVMEGRWTRLALGAWSALVVLFLLFPIVLIVVYAFNATSVQGWPITSFSTKWFRSAWDNTEIRDALWLSVRVGLIATGVALVLRTAAAFAVHRF